MKRYDFFVAYCGGYTWFYDSLLPRHFPAACVSMDWGLERQAWGRKVWKTPNIPCGLLGMTRICQERRGENLWNDWRRVERGREWRREWLGNKGQRKKEWADLIGGEEQTKGGRLKMGKRGTQGEKERRGDLGPRSGAKPLHHRNVWKWSHQSRIRMGV